MKHKKTISLCLFAALLIFLQTNNYLLLSIWGVCAVYLFVTSDKLLRLFVLTSILFGIGFFTYLQVNSQLKLEPRELHIFLNRLSLFFILLPLFAFSFFYKVPFVRYWKKPQWNEFICFPFIWSGFHQTKVKSFLLIALTINFFIFLPFIILNGWSFIQEVWLLTIIFTITNAVLEELVWRGALLSRFSEQLGERWAVVITSLGFGLQHYSLGFPWSVCIGFTLGGLFYGGITIKSGSIFPSLIWHMVLNVLMVFSGFIFS
ncbi:abortive infection protein [Bacillus gobiensis]|uniref:Abortive infection protein n=1 Tax=Bacillus gobiensis TaxID=1441095 RepID=A0A0M4FVX8_9BACI|nr:abortive infection protein [Bacillus gobiensis]